MGDRQTTTSAVNAYYGQIPNLADRALDALKAAGNDINALTTADLAPFDQFHIGGIDATRSLAALSEIAPGTDVIDLGGGVGGAARILAEEFGARVTVVDMTDEFVRSGASLTERLGLSGQVRFRHGDALNVPFGDESFDVTWTQHSTMNIADKERLFAEIHRVLRPGGRYFLHEIVAGSGGPVHFPVPWATEQSISHLRAPGEIRNLLIQDLGFGEIAWQDATAGALDWFTAARQRAATAGQPAVGLHLIMGNDFSTRMSMLGRNLEEGRVQVIQGVVEKAMNA